MSARDDAWTDFELQLLYDVINDVDWFDQVEPHIGRSEAAIRTRMSALRREAEIIPRNGGPKALSERAHRGKKAAEASRKLAAALLALDEVAAPALSEHDRRESETLREVEEELVDGQCEVQLSFLVGPLFDWRLAA